MRSNYTMEHQGLKVSMELYADETWVNHRDLMDAVNKVIGLAECCDTFSLTVSHKEDGTMQ